jgi:hypothetical protein
MIARGEVKIDGPFGEFGLCQDVIEADRAVRAVLELVCCGGDESLACAVGSPFAGLRHHRPCRVAFPARRRDRFAPRQFHRRVDPVDDRERRLAGCAPSADPPGSGAVSVRVFRWSAACSARVIPRLPVFRLVLEDCRLLEYCQFYELPFIGPTSMYRTRLDALSVYKCILGRTQERRELGAACGSVWLSLGGAHVGRDHAAGDADVCAIHVECAIACWALARSPGRRRGYRRRSMGGAAA